MLATILKSQKATQTTLTIIETFARIRNLSRNIKELSDVRDEKKKPTKFSIFAVQPIKTKHSWKQQLE